MGEFEVYNKNDGKEQNANYWTKNPFVFAYSAWHSSEDLLAFVNGIVYIMKLQSRVD